MGKSNSSGTSRKLSRLSKPEFSESDLDELIAEHLAENTPHKGEQSTAQIAAKYHLTVDKAGIMLEGLLAAGKVERNKRGKFNYWKRIR